MANELEYIYMFNLFNCCVIGNIMLYWYHETNLLVNLMLACHGKDRYLFNLFNCCVVGNIMLYCYHETNLLVNLMLACHGKDRYKIRCFQSIPISKPQRQLTMTEPRSFKPVLPSPISYQRWQLSLNTYIERWWKTRLLFENVVWVSFTKND